METLPEAFQPLPRSACWLHQGLRSGFEVVYFLRHSAGLRIQGTTAGLQDGVAFVVGYVIELDTDWLTRTARITSRTSSGESERVLESDGAGHWLVDGRGEAGVEDCLDVDLECSAFTNALPVHRLGLEVGERRDSPAAYVRIEGDRVERLDQTYGRLVDHVGGPRYEYSAPTFDFRTVLTYDRSGLVVDYPGLASRAG